MHYLGIDLGGTNLVVGIVDTSGKILSMKSIPTNAPRSAESICDDIHKLGNEILSEAGMTWEQIQWVGLGSPGIISNGIVIYASNLGFNEVPLEKILANKLKKPTFLQNDANAAAYGEFAVGSGKGYSSLVALTIGTGIGGGIVIDGKVHSGFNGAGGELGHIVIVANGRVCSCGKKGCLEAYTSGTALKEITQEAMDKHKDSLLWDIYNEAGKVSAKTAFVAAKQGDTVAKQIVDDFIFNLSLGVSNAINLLQPEIFCIGGGVSNEGETILAPIRELVKEQTYLTKDEQRAKIVKATLGGDAGLIGAALLGQQNK